MTLRKQPTFADYLVIAVTPALIMLLVGSLVFFLLTAFFDGQYEARVRYIFSLFIFAAVLIGRISIEESQEQAVLFGIPLAIATWIALGRFCETNSLVTISIIAIIWWSAHKLTWDCTVIDEAEEAESGGLLQSAGFESGDAVHRSPDQSLERDTVDNRDSERQRPASLMALWQRWIENRKKPHSPGVWVIYFALATLPLFGIGQWAIPVADLAARRSAFHCLLVYVACAMTLLGTTSFLGIRRYLRQRKLEMPADMAIAWAGTVAGIMVVILLVASCLPRPKPEYSISYLVGSRDIDRPGPFSLLKRDGVDAPHGELHDDSSLHASDRTTEPSDSSETQSENGKRSAERSSDSQDSGRSGQPESNDSSGSQQRDGQQDSSQHPSQERDDALDDDALDDDALDDDAGQDGRSDDGQQSNQDRNPSSRSRQEDRADERRDSSGRSQPSEAQSQNAQEKPEGESPEPRQQDSDPSANTPPRSPQQMLQPILDSLGGGTVAILRLLYWLVLIIAASYFCLRYAGAILAAIRSFLSDFFNLFGGRESPDAAASEEATADSASPRRPFKSFTDPMQSGKSMSDRELVRYTFLALEAWAYENDCGRTADETPLEFEKRLAHSFPRMRDATAYVVQFYDRMAYANSAPRLARDRLGQLWQFMSAST